MGDHAPSTWAISLVSTIGVGTLGFNFLDRPQKLRSPLRGKSLAHACTHACVFATIQSWDEVSYGRIRTRGALGSTILILIGFDDSSGFPSLSFPGGVLSPSCKKGTSLPHLRKPWTVPLVWTIFLQHRPFLWSLSLLGFPF